MVVKVGDKVRVTFEGFVETVVPNGFYLSRKNNSERAFFHHDPKYGEETEVLESPLRVGDVIVRNYKDSPSDRYKILMIYGEYVIVDPQSYIGAPRTFDKLTMQFFKKKED